MKTAHWLLPGALLLGACGVEETQPLREGAGGGAVAEATEDLAKGTAGAANGRSGYCTDPNNKCVSGEGHCQSSAQCATGLVCTPYIGYQFPFHTDVSVCVPPHCSNGKQDAGEGGVDCGGDNVCGACQTCGAQVNSSTSTCSKQCPCDAGHGSCHYSAECASGLVCAGNLAGNYGMPSSAYYVCVAPHCANGTLDGDESDVDCGGADCGTCTTCPVNGAAGHCDGKKCFCGEGETYCHSNAECTGGTVCATSKGLPFGYAASASVCVQSHCANGTQDGNETGVDCGGDCGACVTLYSTVAKTPIEAVSDGTAMYVADYGTANGDGVGHNDGVIWRIDLATGGGARIATAQAQPHSIAVDDTWVYWTTVGTGPDYADGAIHRARKTSGSFQSVLAANVARVAELAADATGLYWSTYGSKLGTVNDSGIYHMGLAGGQVMPLVSNIYLGLPQIVVHNGSVFFTEKAGGGGQPVNQLYSVSTFGGGPIPVNTKFDNIFGLVGGTTGVVVSAAATQNPVGLYIVSDQNPVQATLLEPAAPAFNLAAGNGQIYVSTLDGAAPAEDVTSYPETPGAPTRVAHLMHISYQTTVVNKQLIAVDNQISHSVTVAKLP